ncbi:hypothetical protein LXL04_024482 [Taraxacum kok-saghyz]
MNKDDQAGNQENQKITDIVVRTSPYTKSSAKRSPQAKENDNQASTKEAVGGKKERKKTTKKDQKEKQNKKTVKEKMPKILC